MELAHRRPASLLLLFAVLYAATFLAAPAAAGRGKTGQVAVFWGRKSPDEGYLSEACDSGKYTIVIISFLDVFGQGYYNLDLSGHSLGRIGADIIYCQSKKILVFLSIGGFGSGYSMPSPQAAKDMADYLWNAYMRGRRRDVDRPFGNAEVDGIDFFIENGDPNNYYHMLAQWLWSYGNCLDASKPVQLTATPRCGFPADQLVEQVLATTLFKRIFVRFYDDARCAADWQTEWRKWTAAYPLADIYIGLPASDKTFGYVKPSNLQNVLLPQAQQAANYGGLMVWERNEDKRTGYSNNARLWA